MRLALLAAVLGGALWFLLPAKSDAPVETAASCTTCDARKAGLQSLRDAREAAQDEAGTADR
jgi:hypothetical protein